jgi:hypothetical protein
VSNVINKTQPFTVRVSTPGSSKPQKEYAVKGWKNASHYYRHEMQKAVRTGGLVNIIDSSGSIVK